MLCNKIGVLMGYPVRRLLGMRRRLEPMVQKLLISFTLLALVTIAGGFVVLAVWDVPVAKKGIEKPVDTSKFLQKKS